MNVKTFITVSVLQLRDHQEGSIKYEAFMKKDTGIQEEQRIDLKFENSRIFNSNLEYFTNFDAFFCYESKNERPTGPDRRREEAESGKKEPLCSTLESHEHAFCIFHIPREA